MRSQSDDLLSYSAVTTVGTDEDPDQRCLQTNKQLTVSMVEAKLRELTKIYNAEKE